MKNYKIILSGALLALSACSVNNTKKTSASADSAGNQTVKETVSDSLIAKMQIKNTIKVGEHVELKFTVYNNADTARQFCKWHTPFEPLMSKYLEVKDESGQEMQYKGPMAKRIMPPPAASYIKVNTKDSLSVTADLLKAFDISKPAKYTIVYVGQNMSGLAVKDSVSFVYMK
ncbi:protease [Mucilaginibacter celer]|uniref:Protease n=1 Tax=Mucilaginibacter celer TaxID=2305508 RepID=A0A494VJP9_9SPHI|nr:protease [Mucilaginibacter celer]AYL94514.1 protease [Mucilaginibacter celer]